MWETWVQSLGREDPLEKERITHSSILAWRIPWTEKPGRLQSKGSQRVRHDWATSLTYLLTYQSFSEIGIQSQLRVSGLSKRWEWISVQFSSVTQSCPTLCDPMKHSTPGLPVHHQLSEFTQTYVRPWPVMPSSHLILCHPLLLLPSTSGGQSIEVSASASVLLLNIQDWSPLGWTGWISLQSKGLTRVFSNTTVQKHQPSL